MCLVHVHIQVVCGFTCQLASQLSQHPTTDLLTGEHTPVQYDRRRNQIRFFTFSAALKKHIITINGTECGHCQAYYDTAAAEQL